MSNMTRKPVVKTYLSVLIVFGGSFIFQGTVLGSDRITRMERSFGSGKNPPSRPNSYWDDPYRRPYFDNSTTRNVTAPLGKTAYLHCRIRQIGDRTVSWVRQKDLHILTVGRYTYTSDQRFTSLHLDDSDDWTLKIQYTQKKDGGIYECQVSSEPKISLPIRLNVVVAKATIPGGPNMYVQSGSTINLTCIISDSSAPPVYVFWYHNGRMINYDSVRGVQVKTETGPTTVSRLKIENVKTTDSGDYSCTPSYADPANITVHVINGEKPAAMHHGVTSVGVGVCVQPILVLMLVQFVQRCVSDVIGR
ncbi:V-set and immunoglobulin domain-containing protein 10-like [Tachypleus tridentatus]|uniref:V-set and immunoglobulin domain-containing protein 10-like n=1 Tax=Tachypleus tridentatus TaxID=6853 RepID=UPI003FD16AEF